MTHLHFFRASLSSRIPFVNSWGIRKDLLLLKSPWKLPNPENMWGNSGGQGGDRGDEALASAGGEPAAGEEPIFLGRATIFHVGQVLNFRSRGL